MGDVTSIVIFGASGDLTQRKLIPALYSLHCKGRLPKGANIFGFAITPYSDEEFRAHLLEGMHRYAEDSFDEKAWRDFAGHLHYVTGSFDKTADFKTLDSRLDELEGGPCHRLYYLATAPMFFPIIPARLGEAGMAHHAEVGRRIVVEKPFGHDLKSAEALNKALHAVFDESQIYRIDHYLGKETAQNILFFRFANTLFETAWNRNYIDHVQITVAETVDVGHRAAYYDHAGVLRDMFQNHLMQLLALLAMEPPGSFDADAIRNEKVKIFSALRPIAPEMVGKQTVRGQYKGYRQAEGVDPESQTATYAALRLYIDNWRWQDVPFYLRSGKALSDKSTEIVIQFRRPPHLMFPLPPDTSITPNRLSICIQPDEGIHFSFEAKVPDTVAEMRSVLMDFSYQELFGPRSIPEAYERLLLDALHGDASLFTRSDGIELAWKFIDPIIAGWQSKNAPSLETYAPGSVGPRSARKFIERDGREWMQSCLCEDCD